MTKFNLQSPLHGFAVTYTYGGDDYEYTTVKASNGTFSLELDLVTRGDTVTDQIVFESTTRNFQWDGTLNGEADLIAIHSADGWVSLRKLVTDVLKALADERDADIEECEQMNDYARDHVSRMSSPFLTGRI